jgi:hypothetical protein
VLTLTGVNTGTTGTGLEITSAAAGSKVTLTATSSSASEDIRLSAKSSGNVFLQANGQDRVRINGQEVQIRSDQMFTFSSSGVGSTTDIFLRRNAAANLAFGAADAASPVAQTLSVQNVVAGTSNTAGVNWTFAGSRGTGTGAGGDIIFQTAPAGGSGTTQNTLATAFTIQDDGAVQLKSVTFANLPTVANGYLIYCSDCTIASPCASGGSGALAKGINGAWVCN